MKIGYPCQVCGGKGGGGQHQLFLNSITSFNNLIYCDCIALNTYYCYQWSKTIICQETCCYSTYPHQECSKCRSGGRYWTISPSASRYLRDASHWPCLHSRPQVGTSTICITNKSILLFCFYQKFTRYKKLYLTLVSDKQEH